MRHEVVYIFLCVAAMMGGSCGSECPIEGEGGIDCLIAATDGIKKPCYEDALNYFFDQASLGEVVSHFKDPRIAIPFAAVYDPDSHTVGDLCYLVFLHRIGARIFPPEALFKDFSPLPDELRTVESAKSWWEARKHMELGGVRAEVIGWQVRKMEEGHKKDRYDHIVQYKKSILEARRGE